MMKLRAPWYCSVALLLAATLGAARQPDPSPASPAAADRFLAVPGAVLHYKVMGAGAPLVLLSGGPGIAGDLLMPIARRLSASNTCVIFDQRGTGQSAVARYAPELITVAADLQDLEALRVALGYQRWTVFGHSWGGMLAMAYATRFSDRVAALILADSGGPDISFYKLFDANIEGRLTRQERRAARSLRDRQLSYDWYSPRLLAALPGYVARRTSLALVLAQPHEPNFYNPEVHRFISADLSKHYDLKPALAKLTTPTLIIQGHGDPVDSSTAELTHHLLRNSTLVYVENAGHFAHLENPYAFYAAVSGFLTTVRR